MFGYFDKIKQGRGKNKMNNFEKFIIELVQEKHLRFCYNSICKNHYKVRNEKEKLIGVFIGADFFYSIFLNNNKKRFKYLKNGKTYFFCEECHQLIQKGEIKWVQKN